MAGATMARLAMVAEQRWGLVTTEQAAAVDVSRNALTRLTASGALVRVAQGVYRMAGAPELEHEGIYATWLALGGATRPASDAGVAPVVAAGVTAAILHDIGDFYPEQADFIVPERRGTRLPARLRVRSLTPAEVTFAESVPTLTIERTIADLVGLWTDRSLVADALFSAYEQGTFVRPWQLIDYLEPLARPAGFHDGEDFAADLLALAGIRNPVVHGSGRVRQLDGDLVSDQGGCAARPFGGCTNQDVAAQIAQALDPPRRERAVGIPNEEQARAGVRATCHK